MRPCEYAPERCQAFVAFLHKFRADSGVDPVSDEIAREAFDIIENFVGMWRAADLHGERLDWSLQMKAVPRSTLGKPAE
jgi:hypothetical protein